MRRSHALVILHVVLSSVSATAVASVGEPISIGNRFELESTRIGEPRSYLVHTPADYAFTKDAYPVLVVLDGDDHFAFVSATVDALSRQERMPPMIVVGVPNTERTRDLVPPNPGDVAAGSPSGSDRFLAFIADELVPEIDRRYRTRPYRIIAGHSNGGLFASYALLKRPELFRGYVIISPAFGDNRQLVKLFGPFLEKEKQLSVDVYMTMANESGQMLGGAYELSSLLQEKAARSVRWQFRRYPEETHGATIVMRSIYDGLQAVFDGWYIHDPFALFDQGGIASLEKQYEKVSLRVGYPVAIPERALTAVYVGLESRKRFDEAAAVVQRALELYPTSSYLHFYAGRLYYAMRDEVRGLEYMTKSLHLEPSFVAPRLYLKERGIDASQIVRDVQLPSRILQQFVGSYGSVDGGLQIVLRGDSLYAKAAQREYTLRALSETTMYYLNGENVLMFRRGKRGRMDSLVLQSTGAELVRVEQ